jgi:hypothetical protein
MNATIVFPWGCYFRHYDQKTTHKQILDSVHESFANYKTIHLHEGRDERNKREFEMQNICGYIHYEYVDTTHPAWRKTKSIFGTVRKAFTTSGNIVYQYKRVTFKGCNDIAKLQRVLSQLTSGQIQVYVQLVVMSIGVGCCLQTTQNCPLEMSLRDVGWLRVMTRIEEICNVVIFNVVHWKSMEEHLQLQPWTDIPKSTTVSITRRGTMTIRLTWESMSWTDQLPFVNLSKALSKFVLDFI